MRVAVITESFLPHVNGVTNSVLRVLEHLELRGHSATVIAPTAGGWDQGPYRYAGAPVIRVASLALPGYQQVRVAFARAGRLGRVLDALAPDVVHLASPFQLGGQGVVAAARRGIPSVAVYQTDVAGFAGRYGAAFAGEAMWRRLARIHGQADLTLAPSSAAVRDLGDRGVPRVRHWGRGVDAARFGPHQRDEALRRRLAPNGEVLVGFVGRLAPEKQVERLAVLADMPRIRLVIVGDGPRRAELERQLPGAAFLGFQQGDQLAQAIASLDVMVHPGEHETFCQSIQEALASGVPVVAPAAGGPLDLVDPSRTGWLFAPGDPGSMRSAVQDLVGDERKRRAFGAAARRAVAGRSWERLGDELLDHYRAAIAESRSTRVG